MDSLQEEYEHILEEKEDIIERLNALEGSDVIRRYLSLCNKKNQLIEEEKSLYRQIKYEEFETCSHIWVKTSINYDPYEDTVEEYEGCIKCGLNQAVLNFESRSYQNPDYQIMADFMIDNNYYKGIHSNEACDLSLASAIYHKIKEHHPDIDDKTACKYFEIALNDIRNIEVRESRKISRAKRLSLGKKFKNWYVQDIYND